MPEAQNDGAPQLSEETARLAAIGRGEIDPAAPAAPTAPAAEPPAAPPARPDHVPEKFWDAEKGVVRVDDVLKSYAELEKLRGAAPKEDEPAGDPQAAAAAPEGEPEGDPNADNPAPDVIPSDLFTSARDEYAQLGDLSAETREKIIAAGIDEGTLDTYLAGVKALEAQLEQQVYAAAGGEEAYRAATAWAQKNWDQPKIDKFNAALTDPELRDVAIAGLMAAANVAEPGEGTLHQPGGGAQGSDLYTDKDEFLKDLDAADKANDALARRKAVAKLERSKKAGSLKTVTPRTGLAQLR